ncbi:MAG: zinc-dependent alcohol dehydrogenase [Christensenellales bacterium]|jgi:(R,R)-butanediol dehydrogenase/meso-butanediol dehydrogenase/diacetyl reductase
MKAILYQGPNTIAVKDIDMPTPPEGWGLIKVSHAGICGTDLNIYAGTHPRAKAPLAMGHEFSGYMAEDAPGLKKGTRVAVFPLLSCGECTPCLSGNTHVCNTLELLGIDCDGGMAEYAIAPLDKIVKLPDAVSDKMGAFVEPVAVAVHTLRETGFIPGDNALVFGCGTIGLAVAVTLRKYGAISVTMVESDPARAAIGRDMGFEVFDPTNTDIPKMAAEKTNGDGFDWVFDCAGVQAVASTLLDVVKVRGNIVIVAGYKKPAELPLLYGMFKEVTIKFVRVYRLKDFEIAAKITAEEPDYEKIVTHVLPADEAQKGFDLITTKGSGAVKVMFNF